MIKQIFAFSLLFGLLGQGIWMFLNPKSVIEDVVFPKEKKVNKIDVFQEVKIFFTKDSKEYIKFDAEKLTVLEQKQGEMEKPKALIINDKLKFNLQSDYGVFDLQTKNNVEVKGNVKVFSVNYDFECNEGVYTIKNKKFIGVGNVKSVGVSQVSGDKIIVHSKKITAYPFTKKTYLEDVKKGRIFRKRKYQGFVGFKAKKLSLDYDKSLVELEENVELNRNNVTCSSHKASIFLENFNKRLNYYKMEGNVVIKQRLRDRDGQKFTRYAYAENLVGNVKKKRIVLTGSPRVKSKNDLIRGSKIILRENASIIEVKNSSSQIDIKDKS